MTMRSVEEMSFLITGGGTGIGAGTAKHLLSHGARVTICGRRREPLEGVATEGGAGCRAVQADITKAPDRRRAIRAAVEHGGGLDVLVNAAANMYRGALGELNEEELLAVYHSNVVAPMMLSKLALPHLQESHGAIIFFGSVHSVRAFPGASPYAGTKGALETLTGVLAAELGADDIRVSCVRPGAVFTDLNLRAGLGTPSTALNRLEQLAPAHALGRIGTATEVAEAVAYLACAEWVTGSTLVVDGGLGLGVTNA